MTMNNYQLDSEVELSGTFTSVEDGSLLDPTEITLFVKSPNGIVNSYTTGIQRVSMGIYTYDIVVDQAGPWIYKWQGKGNVEVTTSDTYFQVVPSVMPV